MVPETDLHTTPTSPAADALSYWDGFIHSIPQPVLPPENDCSQMLGILRATRPLLDSDRDWILPNIAHLESQLPIYDSLMNRLQTVFKELKTYRATIQRVSKEFSSTLAPVRRLPSDVLRSIFREIQSPAFDRSGISFGGPFRSSIEFMHNTLNLSRVCYSWRDIVVSSPELWSHMRIAFSSPSRDSPGLFSALFNIHFPAMKTILPLSGQLPLDIRFILDDSNPSVKAIEAFSLLLGERHRWRTASLTYSFDLLEQLKACTGKLASLESLTIMPTSSQQQHWLLSPVDDWVPPPGNVNDVFIDAPNLRKVVLYGGIEDVSFALPFQLTHLATCFTSIHNLHTHTLLGELHLETRCDEEIASLHDHITLPNVWRLSVVSLKTLRHLRLPALEDLKFDSYLTDFTDELLSIPSDTTAFIEDEAAEATLTISDFIRSSRCSLTSLATTSSIIYASSFTQEAFPLLESLTRLEYRIIPVYERRLYDALMSPKVLPDLRYLMMRLPLNGMEDISQDALSTMLTSRGQHLLSVRIECPITLNDRHVRVLDSLEPLRQLGVDLKTVAYGDPIGIKFGEFA
ncbi:hypothetical protein EDD18DRAFT_1333100 [Armillaria luteobubalina]|uniref:F-box domain-containing protein n=1 Tax=Armillaria luteobubalina TaxID=153913 RepID=A0AA39Q385_9AGAR|nr:hypothetical protein EDD18DRAFT_1333100 [Armillaria luteobubalina]